MAALTAGHCNLFSGQWLYKVDIVITTNIYLIFDGNLYDCFDFGQDLDEYVRKYVFSLVIDLQ